MKELKSYIQSVNTCSDSLIREVWSDQDECSMIFPKGEVEGAMAQYETRDLQQDDVKIQEFCDITIVRFYWTLYATMKDSGEHIMNKGRETQIYRSYPQGKKLVHVHYSRLP